MIGIVSAQPANITSSHVFQKTEVFRTMLEHGELVDLTLNDAPDVDDSLRHPRHVMQKVRECHILLSKVLQKNGKTAEPLPKNLTPREVKPEEVYEGVQHLIQEAGKLAENDGDAVDVPFESGKVPSDAYNNLDKICHAMNAEIVPSDVYQVAVAVRDNIAAMAKERGYDANVALPSIEDKVPADVYKKTRMFMQDLRLLALNPDYAIPGGVMFAEPGSEAQIIPQDVIAIMHDAYAETKAIKYSLHIESDTELPEYEGGKQPSDVYAVLEQAHEIVRQLIVLERKAEREIIE